MENWWHDKKYFTSQIGYLLENSKFRVKLMKMKSCQRFSLFTNATNATVFRGKEKWQRTGWIRVWRTPLRVQCSTWTWLHHGWLVRYNRRYWENSWTSKTWGRLVNYQTIHFQGYWHQCVSLHFWCFLTWISKLEQADLFTLQHMLSLRYKSSATPAKLLTAKNTSTIYLDSGLKRQQRGNTPNGTNNWNLR